MTNNRNTFFILLGAWCFGFTLNFQGYFQNASTFFLTHEISTVELSLFITAMYLLFPIIAFLIFLIVKRFTNLGYSYLIVVVALLMAQGLVKTSDLILKLVLPVYFVMFIFFLFISIYFLAKVTYLNKNIRLIMLFIPISLIYMIFNTNVINYYNINKEISIDKFQNNGKNVTIIIFDELSLLQIMSDPITINKSRFPGFYALSQVTTFYPNMTANAGYTDYAVPSILSGAYPELFGEKKKANINYDYPKNLIKILSADYKIKAEEPVSNFCLNLGCKSTSTFDISFRYRTVLLQDLRTLIIASIIPVRQSEKYFPKIKTSWGDYLNELEGQNLQDSYLKEDRTSGLRQFILESTTKSSNSFNLIHPLFPHSPYQYLPDGRRVANVQANQLVPEAQDLTLHGDRLNQSYLLQLKYLDALILDLANKLKNEMVDELVIITSDHGVSFAEKESWRGSSQKSISDSKVMASLMYVPLFIHWPGESGGEISEKNIQSIDIYPTVLDFLEINDNNLGSDGIGIKNIDEHKKPWWYLQGFNLSYEELEQSREELIKKTNNLFSDNKTQCDLYGYGPYGGIVCKNIDEFNIIDSELRYIEVSDDEVNVTNDEENFYIQSYIVFSDKLSEELRNNSTLKKSFAVAYKGKILSVTEGIITKSLRDEGKALDLQIHSILAPSEEKVDLNKIEIFEIISSDTLSKIKY
jgi:hypothetical protein